MALPVYFPTIENTIDEVTGLPVVKLSTATKTIFGGTSFKNYLTADNSGGTTVASGHIGGDISHAYSTVNAISAKMALLYNAHGNVVTPEFGLAVTDPSEPFNFAGIALSDSTGGTQNWNQKYPAAGDVIPSQRTSCQLSYFGSRNRVVLFGGEDNSVLKGDTWEWNGTNWTEIVLSGPPSARKWFGFTGVTFSSTDSVLLYGGYNTNYINETWVYSGSSWHQSTPAHTPGARANHGMVFDSIRGKVVVFGGSDGYSLNDTWEFNGTDWTQITTAHAPSARRNVAMAYDSFRNKVILFGGSNGTADTWEYNGTDWTQIFVAGDAPHAREKAGMVYDIVKKKIILFGGINGATDLSDTWEYDGNSWTRLNTVGPPARDSFGITYDSGHNKTVLFGGGNSALIGGNRETWELSTSTSAVTLQTAGDGLVYYDATAGRPAPVIGDFLGPSSVAGTVTPVYDGYSAVFGIVLENPVSLSTVLSEDTNNAVTTITVSSTTGFPTSGTIHIDDEDITYTGTTTTTLTGCTRGVNGTLAASHLKDTKVFSTAALTLMLNGSMVGLVKMRIRPFYGFISPLPQSIINFTPSAAEVGDLVTLNGTVFIGTTQVKINTPTTTASYSVISNNQITFTVPAGAGKGTITVTNAQGNSTSSNPFVTLPSITGVLPTAGAIGDSIVISGHAFTDAYAVKFNGVTASFSVDNDSQITATIPAGGASGNIDVLVSYSGDIRIGTYENFGVVAQPTITNVAPLSGAIDGYVAVTGSGFRVGGLSVNFVDVATMTQILPATFTVYNDTTISVKTPNPGVPQPSKNYYVRVTTAGGVILSTQQYTIIPIPQFLATPGPTFYNARTMDAYGVAGDTVVIEGDYGFTGVSEVTFNGFSSPHISFVNDGYITALVPNVASVIDVMGPVRVVAGGGAKSTDESPATLPVNFTIQQTPTITSFTPLTGKTGDIVTITGSNLLSVSNVIFTTDAYAASFTVVNSSTITAIVPGVGSGIVSSPSKGHIILTKGVFIATSSQQFEFYPPPTISGVTPAPDGGGFNGGIGTSVTISGSSLTGGGTPIVRFGTTIQNTISASPSSITCIVPAGAGNGVSVTTLGGVASASFTLLQQCSISSFYTDWPYDHHAATPYYPSVIDVYGSNFRPSPFMTVTIIDPARGYSSINVTYTYFDSTHFRFTAATLGAFSGGDTCYIQVTTTYPGGSYVTNVYGLVVFNPI